MNTEKLKGKKEKLISALKKLDSLLVAFSGGVDSTFLLAVANNVMKGNVAAVTSISSLHSLNEKDSAVKTAKGLGVNHLLITTSEYQIYACGIFFTCLDLEQKNLFMDGHKL